MKNANYSSDDHLDVDIIINNLEEKLKGEMNTFDEFVQFLRKIDHSSRCKNTWEYPSLCIYCLDCSSNSNADAFVKSVICIPCYLNGSHKGHNIEIISSFSGSCDCGNALLCPEQHFCQNHHSPLADPFKPEFTKSLQESLETAFLELILIPDVRVYKWIFNIINIGDGCSRCFANIFAHNEGLMTEVINLFPEIGVNESRSLGKIMNFMNADCEFFSIFANCIFDIHLLIVEQIQKINRRPSQKVGIQMNGYIEFAKSMINAFLPNYSKYINIYKDGPKWLNYVKNVLQIFTNLVEKADFQFLKKTIFSVMLLNEFRLVVEAGLSTEECRKYLTQFNESFYGFLEFLSHFACLRKVIGDFDDDEYEEIRAQHMIFSAVLGVFGFLEKNNMIDESIFGAFLKYWNTDTDLKSGGKCVFDGETVIYLLLPIHTLAGLYLRDRIPEAPEIIKKYALINKMEPDDLYCALALHVIRLLSSIRGENYGLFEGTSVAARTVLLGHSFKSGIVQSLSPLFSLLQIMLGLVSDKGKILHMIADSYGFPSTTEECHKLHFSTIHTVSALLFNRSIIKKDLLKMKRTSYSNTLRSKPMKWTELISSWIETEFDQDIFNYCTRKETQGGVIWNLNSDEYVDFLCPWSDISRISEIITYYDKESPGVLPPYPSYEPIEGLDIESVFQDPFLMDILMLAFNGEQRNPTMVAALPIVKHMVEMRMDIAPLIDAIKSIPFAARFLNDWGMTDSDESTSNELELHKESISLQNSILRQFRASQVFLFESEEEEEEDKSFECGVHLCCVCETRTEEPLGYPLFHFKSAMWRIQDMPIYRQKKRPFYSVTQIHICQHLIHKSCSNISQSCAFKCPIDRAGRNALLPLMVNTVKTESTIDSIRDFLSSVYGTGPYSQRVTTTLCNHIALLEIRARSCIMCLTKPTNLYLVQNLYRLLVEVIKMEKNEEVDMVKAVLIESAVFKQAQSPTPLENFEKSLSDILSKSSNNTELIVTLRRYAIFQKMLELPECYDLSSINWKKLLDSDNLFRIYQVPRFDIPELRPYSINLPKNYVDIFGRESFKSQYSMSNRYMICLTTQRTIFFQEDRSEHDFLQEYIMRCCGMSAAAFFVINGPRAGDLKIVCMEYQVVVFLKSPYVSDNGEEDIGFNLGSFPRLSETRCCCTEEKLLLGDWVTEIPYQYITK